MPDIRMIPPDGQALGDVDVNASGGTTRDPGSNRREREFARINGDSTGLEPALPYG